MSITSSYCLMFLLHCLSLNGPMRAATLSGAMNYEGLPWVTSRLVLRWLRTLEKEGLVVKDVVHWRITSEGLSLMLMAELT